MAISLGTYKLSGRIGWAALTVPIAALLAAAIGSTFYGLASAYSPWNGKVLAVVNVALGIGLGFSISCGAFLSRCRNPWFARFVATIAGLSALYVSWCVFLHGIVARDPSVAAKPHLTDYLFNPAFVWTLIRTASASGSPEFGGGRLGCLILRVQWALEALAMVGLPVYFSTWTFAHRVYCEHCGRWCRTMDGMLRVICEPRDDVIARLVAAGPRALVELPIAPRALRPYVSVDATACDRCHQTATYALRLLHEIRANAEAPVDRLKSLTPRLVISAEDFQALRARARRPGTVMADTRRPAVSRSSAHSAVVR